MKKIYISIPTLDLFEDEIPRRHEHLLELAGEYLHEPVEAIRKYDVDTNQSELEQLGESIKRMSEADYVLLSGDWRSERQTEIEMACAIKYKKAILIEDSNKIIEEVT